MSAGHISLKASLSGFSTECECGDDLQMEEHNLLDCKRCQDPIMMDILSENSEKEYPKSVTELFRLQEKRFVQGVCYFINTIPNLFFKKKEVNVHHINSIFLELGEMFKYRGVTLMME
jgi:hypothetical protein